MEEEEKEIGEDTEGKRAASVGERWIWCRAVGALQTSLNAKGGLAPGWVRRQSSTGCWGGAEPTHITSPKGTQFKGTTGLQREMHLAESNSPEAPPELFQISMNATDADSYCVGENFGMSNFLNDFLNVKARLSVGDCVKLPWSFPSPDKYG